MMAITANKMTKSGGDESSRSFEDGCCGVRWKENSTSEGKLAVHQERLQGFPLVRPVCLVHPVRLPDHPEFLAS